MFKRPIKTNPVAQNVTGQNSILFTMEM